MRVNNAKLTSQNGDPSKRIAKRAVLLAVLVASGTTVGGQQPQGGMIQSRFFNQNNAPPGIVHGGARAASPIPVGAVQSNPFVAPGQAPATPANGAVQYPAMAGGYPSMAASRVGRVRQNTQFHASSATGVSDQPLSARAAGWISAGPPVRSRKLHSNTPSRVGLHVPWND